MLILVFIVHVDNTNPQSMTQVLKDQKSSDTLSHILRQSISQSTQPFWKVTIIPTSSYQFVMTMKTAWERIVYSSADIVRNIFFLCKITWLLLLILHNLRT